MSDAQSSQRAQFDSALRVLLAMENLDGTRWAVEQLREEGVVKFGPGAAQMANWLEGKFDRRTVQLVARE